MKPAFLALAKRVAMATLFVYGAGCAAQDFVTRPEVKVDDRWLYRRMDHRFEPPVLLYELRVSFVDARAIHTVLARQGKPRDSDATWTPEWNGVVSVDEGIVDIKAGGLLQFPLAPGRSYSSTWEMRRPRARSSIGRAG